MASLWLYAESIPAVGAAVEIGREEARHAFGARRLGSGDLVTLFDGLGTTARARLADERTRRGDMTAVVEERSSAPPLAPEVTIAFAVPKGDRLSTLLDLATQAGASRLVPIECARSVVDAEKLDRSERWQRIVHESAKVAKRPWMPELVAGGALGAVAEAERARGAALAVAHTGATATAVSWSARQPAAAPRTVFIGPEGGFEDAEIAALRGFGAETVSLGPCVMRVEMAAVAAAVLLRGEQPVVQP